MRLELSTHQVALVRDHAAECGNLQALLSEPDAYREVLSDAYREIVALRRTISSSLTAGLLIFAIFPSDGTAIGNSEVARILGINPSTSHRYIHTLAAVGLVEQEPGTRKYRLAR